MSIRLDCMQSNENCPICFDPMGSSQGSNIQVKSDLLGHIRANGTSCCYHRACITASARVADVFKCWICHQTIDKSSLVPLKDRCIHELKLLGRDGYAAISEYSMRCFIGGSLGLFILSCLEKGRILTTLEVAQTEMKWVGAMAGVVIPITFCIGAIQGFYCRQYPDRF